MFLRRNSAIDSFRDTSDLGSVRQTIEPCQQLHLNGFLVIHGRDDPQTLCEGLVQSLKSPKFLQPVCYPGFIRRCLQIKKHRIAPLSPCMRSIYSNVRHIKSCAGASSRVSSYLQGLTLSYPEKIRLISKV